MDADAVMTDEMLVRRARGAGAGDTRAFDELIRRHQAGVATNCRYLSGSADDAQDLTQEVFVKAYFGLARFDGRAAFRTWLHRIKVNHCLNHLRRRATRRAQPLDDVAAQRDPAMKVDATAHARLEAADRRRRIGDIVDRLPDTLRVPLIMRDVDELSYRDIADALGIGLSAAKMRVSRAREEFRRMWTEDETGEHTGARTAAASVAVEPEP